MKRVNMVSVDNDDLWSIVLTDEDYQHLKNRIADLEMEVKKLTLRAKYWRNKYEVTQDELSQAFLNILNITDNEME